MTTKDTGGPAFPSSRDMRHNPDFDHEEGMTLRDYFAAKAMQANMEMLSDTNLPDWNAEIARLSYLVAEAMMAERNKQ